jgi:dihydroorotate dehydrogenase (NAD+) catalytic subunit
MIELAPHHKFGLSLTNPVMIASGFAGYGPAYQRLLDLSAFGAIVTNPITLRPRSGPTQPRLVETPGGFILNIGGQNPGVKRVIQQYQHHWARLPIPIIAHLPADEADALQRTARALSGLETSHGQTLIAAIELGLPPETQPWEVNGWLGAVQADSPLPVLVKLPVTPAAPDLAIAAAEANADAIVIGAPPLGAVLSPTTGASVTGLLFGPALHSLILLQLYRIKNWVDLPVVAVGGIHTLAETQTFLAAGASAVQLDSLLFIEPRAAEAVAQAFAEPKK